MDTISRYEKSVNICGHLDLIAIKLIRCSNISELNSDGRLRSSVAVATDYFKSRKPVESFIKEIILKNNQIEFNEHYIPLTYEEDERLVLGEGDDVISDIGTFLKVRKYDLVGPYLTDGEKKILYVELRQLIRKFSASRAVGFGYAIYSHLYKLLTVLLDGLMPRMERMAGRAFILGLLVMAAYIVFSIYVIRNGGCTENYIVALSVYTIAIVLLFKSCRYTFANRFDWLALHHYDLTLYIIAFVNIFNVGILFKEFVFGGSDSSAACLVDMARLVHVNELFLEYLMLYVIVWYLMAINILPFIMRRDKKVLDEWRESGGLREGRG